MGSICVYVYYMHIIGISNRTAALVYVATRLIHENVANLGLDSYLECIDSKLASTFQFLPCALRMWMVATRMRPDHTREKMTWSGESVEPLSRSWNGRKCFE